MPVSTRCSPFTPRSRPSRPRCTSCTGSVGSTTTGGSGTRTARAPGVPGGGARVLRRRRPRTWFPSASELFSEMSARTLPADESVSWARGGYVYSTRTVEGREYTQLLRRNAEDLAAEVPSTVILDENELADGHDYCRVGVCEPSPDGRLLAYAFDLDGGRGLHAPLPRPRVGRGPPGRRRARPLHGRRPGRRTPRTSSTPSRTPPGGLTASCATSWVLRRPPTCSSSRRPTSSSRRWSRSPAPVTTS